MLPLLALMVAAPLGQQDPSPDQVSPPRIPSAEVVVDGHLSEPVWAEAAALRGFYQYLPTDDRPAADSTVVFVFYAETAIYFGIRAYQDSSLVSATLADRDKITGDDYVEILLDTFNDRRQAFLFGVNPLGVQADGTLRDAAQRNANFTSTVTAGAYAIDLSPDFVYDSKGHLTAFGYEIEVRIPFKTLRYQAAETQDWGVN
ncbi:MAG: carbohydrate binding family 9 domain-containing protein, partial [Gemmatimonadales bacterium]|nr:carbohydrate binding family 9 domain-containing protein [Gemmatimonadales bacterium]